MPVFLGFFPIKHSVPYFTHKPLILIREAHPSQFLWWPLLRFISEALTWLINQLHVPCLRT